MPTTKQSQTVEKNSIHITNTTIKALARRLNASWTDFRFFRSPSTIFYSICSCFVFLFLFLMLLLLFFVFLVMFVAILVCSWWWFFCLPILSICAVNTILFHYIFIKIQHLHGTTAAKPWQQSTEAAATIYEIV